MKHAWTLMSVLFFTAQLVSIATGYRNFKQPYHQHPLSTIRTVFSATTRPPYRNPYETSNEHWNGNDRRRKPNSNPTKPPFYDVEHFSTPSTCPNYTQQFEKYRNEMENNMVLNLSNTGVQKLNNLFIHSSYIKVLYLNDNNITEISTMAFHGLPKLEFLSLSNNNITTENLLYLKGHETLKTLLLDDNKYNPRDGSLEQVFDNMPKLKELSLKRDGITRFAVKLKEFAPSLTNLYLSGNKIKSVNFLNDAPETLSNIYLDNNNIGNLTGYKLNNVQELFVNENDIMEVCTKEGCIEDDGRRLTLNGMTKLVKLNVSSNKISNVAQDAFIDTKNLVELDLSNNKIAELPNDVFKRLSSLEILRISKNQLMFVPNLCWLSRLTSLDLSNNHIMAVTRDSFCNVQLMDTNNILKADDDGFSNLRMLESLDLSGNRIVNFPVELLVEPTYLKVLLLKDNNIVNINDLFNVRSNTLKELHLEGNPLLTISVSFMPNLKIHLVNCKEKTELETTNVVTTTSEEIDSYES
ncbi:Leucine-rich repeats and immunoglobulin-like domains protein 3 [Anthophora plagiata]